MHESRPIYFSGAIHMLKFMHLLDELMPSSGTIEVCWIFAIDCSGNGINLLLRNKIALPDERKKARTEQKYEYYKNGLIEWDF